ncbi:RNA-guided endonuclease TnpB family protein [Moorena sp. SIO4G3]|uniref:RNA-guided endonuclease InsQ/TnpB family protein n=1 Tax=Moorena sp. SIO4G3 TaxID=2607821 RepID=UPI0025CB9E2C|nr:RNA-guided endonuclease TnpB family protein [Moorena sp. SIO4G3]
MNNFQRTLLAKHAGTARHAYNWGLALCKQILEHNKNNPSDKIKFPTDIELHKWLNRLVKPNNTWYYDVSKCAPQQALRDLRKAFRDFFNKKLINGKPVGFPRFKKKYKHDSFYLDGRFKVDHFKIKVPVIGELKTYERLPQGIKVKNVTISRQADRWFISFKIEEEIKFSTKKKDVVGVDLGVKALATLSTGEVREGAKSYRRFESKLSRMQRLNRNKIKGSKNYKKAQCQIARLHKKVANIRKDTLHNLTTYLAKNHGKIVIEDLNVSGMLANHKLAKAIGDLGFYEFRRQLEYKCELYGSELIIADRWFPSSKTCSNCGCKKETLSLSERVYHCDNCGVSLDRDLNAAKNLAALAVSSTVSACGVESADTP